MATNPSSIFKLLSDLQQDSVLEAKFRKETETWNDPDVISENLRTSADFDHYNLTKEQWDTIVRYQTEALMIANLCNNELQGMIQKGMC